MTKGNNFKSRVYPIPANGTKRIVVAYEQELNQLGIHDVYNLPLSFEDKLSSLDISANVFHDHLPKVRTNGKFVRTFINSENQFQCVEHYDSVHADEAITFAIPNQQNTPVINIERAETGDHFFYSTYKLNPAKKEKKLPSSLTLIWDVSGSNKNSNKEKEIELLKRYLEKVKSGTIELVTFSNAIHTTTTFNISNGTLS